MHTNVIIDDELETSKTNTGIWDLTEIKCQLRVTNIHSDLDWNLWQHTTRNFSYFSLNQAVINMAFIALCARDRHHHAILQMLSCIAATNHCRNAQLTSNNRRVTSTATTISHNRRSALHDWLPVRVSHISNQYVTRLYTVHLAWITNHANWACTNLLTNRTTFGENLRCALELVTHLYLPSSLTLHRLWSCLQDVNTAVLTIFTPLDIHWTTVVLLNDDGIFC